MQENSAEYTDPVPEFQPSDLIEYGKIDEVTKAASSGSTGGTDATTGYS